MLLLYEGKIEIKTDCCFVYAKFTYIGVLLFSVYTYSRKQLLLLV